MRSISWVGEALHVVSEVFVAVSGTSFLAFAITVVGTPHHVPSSRDAARCFRSRMTRFDAGRESLIKICTGCAETRPGRCGPSAKSGGCWTRTLQLPEVKSGGASRLTTVRRSTSRTSHWSCAAVHQGACGPEHLGGISSASPARSLRGAPVPCGGKAVTTDRWSGGRGGGE